MLVEEPRQLRTSVRSLDADLRTRLAEVIDSLGESRAARVVDKHVKMLRRYVQGLNEPPISVVIHLAAAAGVRIEWLINGEGPKLASSTASANYETASDFVKVPVMDLALSAGVGALALAPEAPREFLTLPVVYLRGHLGIAPEAAFAVSVVGDSMEKTLRDGDLAIVDSSCNAVDRPGIYALRRGDDLFVKRVLRRTDGSLLLKADNPDYPEESLTPDRIGELQVIGRIGGKLSRP